MHVRKIRHEGRPAWEVGNGELALAMTEGGGHLASLRLASHPRINPFWTPPWRTIDPWQYGRAAAPRYGGSPLLASVCGHLLCLPHFGAPSEAEARQGQDVHGEAPVGRWRAIERAVTARHARLRTACDLTAAGLSVERAITVRPASRIVEVTEEIVNRRDADRVYTLCEHATFGPPFLAPGVTCFDMPAREGHTFPGAFSDRQRLRPDTAFEWPGGPGADAGVVDLRTLGRRRTSDFTTQHIDREREDAWFSALNPRLGLLVVYHWRRRDFPWVGNWEENRCRRGPPWNGRTVARGMEFANTPFPTNLREQVGRGRMHGEPTYAWLPARGTVHVAFRIAMLEVTARARGVADVRATPSGLAVDLLT